MSADASLPDLPPSTDAEALRALDAAGLDALAGHVAAAERAVAAAMAPYERRLREIRARAAEVATERRRRERAEQISARAAVRSAAGSAALPALADVLADPALAAHDGVAFRDLPAYLPTGGEVGFGFATKPGVVGFTDGRRVQQATTLGAARALWSDGWEPGAPGVPGVRVHLAGTRVERVVPADGVVVRLHSSSAEGQPAT